MKNKIVIAFSVLAAMILACILIFYLCGNTKSNLIKENEQALSQKISSLNDKVGSIHLKEVTPFIWDEVYLFAPYYDSKEILEANGIHWNGYKPSPNEGTMQVVFVNEKEVVCYCFGYPSTERYYIDCVIKNNEQYRLLLAKRNPMFSINMESGVMYLRLIE